MGIFDDFIEKDGIIVKNGLNWIEWDHEGIYYAGSLFGSTCAIEEDLYAFVMFLMGHCDDCGFAGGCYFLESKMPQNPVAGDNGLMHPNCHCKKIAIDKPIPYESSIAVCPIEKFTEYIFNEEKSGGKTAIFTELGYSKYDSPSLVREYERQAVTKYSNGDYKLYKLNNHGFGVTIIIDLGSRQFKTGWKVRAKGIIVNTTPFSGKVKEVISGS